MTPAVTIGLPVFNNVDSVAMAIRSVFAQTLKDWRLVVVDDGSSDGSLELLHQITDPRVVVLADGSNRGLAERLNQLADIAQTPLLARMDADDIMHPDRLESQLAVLQQSSAALVFSHAVAIDASDHPTGLRRSLSAPPPHRYFRNSPYIHPTLIGHTQWFRSNRYDPGFRRCQDQELWVRTMGRQAVVTLEQPLLYLREAGTISSSKYASSMRGTRSVLARHGRDRLGRVGTLVRVAETYAKQSAYALAERAGRTDAVVHSRADALTESERDAHLRTLAEIRRTRVPGWEDR